MMPRARKLQPVPGQAYGRRQQQEQVADVAAAQPSPQQRIEQLGEAAGAMSFGGGLLAPTQRPDEPVTAGLPVGPGAGPPDGTPGAVEGQLPVDPRQVARWLPILEQLARRPGTSRATVAFVRDLRASLPPDVGAEAAFDVQEGQQ